MERRESSYAVTAVC